MQNAAFQDLCFLAEASGPDAWRRKMVGERGYGEAWQKLGIACMDEVQLRCFRNQNKCIPPKLVGDRTINLQEVFWLEFSPGTSEARQS